MKKFIAVKFNSLNYYQLAAFLGLLGQAMLFVTEIFVARQLGPIDFGSFALFVLIVEIVQIVSFKSLALTYSIKREISERSLCLSLLFSIILSVLVMLLFQKAEQHFNLKIIPEVDINFFIIVIAFCLSDYYLKMFFLKIERYTAVNIIDFLSICIYIFLLIGFVLNGFGWLSFVYSYMCRFGFKVLVYIFYIDRKRFSLGRNLSVVDFKFSFSLTLQSFFLFSTSNIDKAVITNKLGDASLGVYSRAQKLIYTPFEQIIRSASNISFSKMNNSNSEEKVVIFLNTFRLVLYTLLPVVIFIVFNSNFIVVTVYGNNWLQMSAILPQISIVAMLSLLSIPVGDFLKSNGIVYRELVVNFFAFAIFVFIVLLLDENITLINLASSLILISSLVLFFQFAQASKFFKISIAFSSVFDLKKVICIVLFAMLNLILADNRTAGFILGSLAALFSSVFFIKESIRLRKI
jgi:O-antigen/teichoic acid export membrane protein